MKQKKRISVKDKNGKSVKGVDLTTTIKKDLYTPVCKVAYCAIFKPVFFPGNPFPRFRLMAEFENMFKNHREFLKMIKKIGKENGVASFGKETEEKSKIIIFQTKEKPDIFLKNSETEELEEIELDHDLPPNMKCQIEFTLKTYPCKKSKKDQFSFCPTKIIIFDNDEDFELDEVLDGDC